MPAPKRFSKKILSEESPRFSYFLGLSFGIYRQYQTRYGASRTNLWRSGTCREAVGLVKRMLRASHQIYVHRSYDSLTIYDESLAERMMSFGLDKNPSERRYPHHLGEMVRPAHFMRGVWETRGRVSSRFSPYRPPEMHAWITQGEGFLDDLEQLLVEEGVEADRPRKDKLSFDGIHALRFHDLIYKDTQPGLYIPERKEEFPGETFREARKKNPLPILGRADRVALLRRGIEKGLSLQEATRRAGYTAGAAAARAFKRETGMTRSEYRESLLNTDSDRA